MKYRSVDRLRDFDFHDSEMKLLSLTNDTLSLSVRHLNIHKETAQNDSEFNMEIDNARMTFTSFSVRSLETEDDPDTALTADAALHHLLRNLQHHVTVFSLTEENSGEIEMDASGDCPYFLVRIGFDSVCIEWDSYRQKAWYELHRYWSKALPLSTATGEQTVKADITFHEEDVYSAREGKMLPAPLTVIHLRLDGQDYVGTGSDEYWIDAFADLQKKLPEGVTIRCCLTCRHGNLCPTGNNLDELFCTRDVAITQKSDLYFYTEDPAQRTRRLRGYTNVCSGYEPQCDPYYTYNDYLHFLKA